MATSTYAEKDATTRTADCQPTTGWRRKDALFPQFVFALMVIIQANQQT